MEALHCTAFWWYYALSLLGLLAYLLVSWANPGDDSITGTLREIFGRHSRTVVVSIIGCFGVCLWLFEQEQLTAAAAVFGGYGVQSLLEKARKFYELKAPAAPGP